MAISRFTKKKEKENQKRNKTSTYNKTEMSAIPTLLQIKVFKLKYSVLAGMYYSNYPLIHFLFYRQQER